MNRIGYYLREGVSSIFTHSLMSFATVCIILACLLIMGSFATISLNVNNIIDHMEQQNQVAAFVDERLTEAEARELEPALLAVPNVAAVQYMDRQEAMDRFLARLKDNSLYDELEADTFRSRFLVSLDDISVMARTQQNLADIPGIAEVSAHLGIARGLVSVRGIVNIVSLVIIAILFLVSMFIMANTLRLAAFARRNEVAIVRMIGATNGFIRGPFTVEGMILGVLGSLLAYLLQWSLYVVLTARITESSLSFVQVIPFGDLALPLLVAFLGLGCITAVFGSRIAIRSYMRV